MFHVHRVYCRGKSQMEKTEKWRKEIWLNTAHWTVNFDYLDYLLQSTVFVDTPLNSRFVSFIVRWLVTKTAVKK